MACISGEESVHAGERPPHSGGEEQLGRQGLAHRQIHRWRKTRHCKLGQN